MRTQYTRMFSGTAWSMWRCSVAISHSGVIGLTHSEKAANSVQDDPTWRTTEFNSLFPCPMLIQWRFFNTGFRATARLKSGKRSSFLHQFQILLDLLFKNAEMCLISDATSLHWILHRATSILFQECCSSFVNKVLGRSHYPYESQRSIHCGRLTKYCRRWLH